MRRIALLTLLAAIVLIPTGAVAQEDGPEVDIVVISGVLDKSAIDFVIGRVEAAEAKSSEAVIIQINSPATVSDTILELITTVQRSSVPIVVWVGPDPAVAYGGAVAVLTAAEVRAAAPGAEIGYAAQIQAGGLRFTAPEAIAEKTITVGVSGAGDAGVLDLVTPSINNLLVDLDGMTVVVNGAERVLETVVEGPDGLTPVSAVFWEPGLGTRILRLAVAPEALFFFLVMGLMIAAFEFYAIGPGLAAVVASMSLLVASYGLVTLPIRWWSIALILFGLWLMTVDYQRGGAGPMTWVAAVILYIGGLFIVDAAPQLVPSWWVVLVVVIAVLLWYMFAMTTVARSRFSTPTIGRDHMIGRRGTAMTEFGPLGEVEVDGARWSASAHRAAGLRKGSSVEIVGVDGRFLEVEPSENE